MTAGPGGSVGQVEVRRLRLGDLPAFAAAVARARAADELLGSADPGATFMARMAELEPDNVAVAVRADELIGFLSADFKVAVVEPSARRRGIGRRLVEAAIEIERDRGRSDVILGVLPVDADGKAFLSATGFAYHSTLWDLGLPPSAVVPSPVWPGWVNARAFDQARDAWTFQRLFNVTFADHPTPMQISDAMVEQPPDPRIQDDDTLLLEDADGEPLAFCSTTPNRADGVIGPRGEVWTIGVRPDLQGRGLGRQLLRWGVERLRSIGAEEISLSVNGRNERALGLYEGEGFRRASTRERWARPVGSGDAPPSAMSHKAD